MPAPSASAADARPTKLSLVLFSGSYDKVHYALAMAAAALASNTPATLFFTMGAARALLAEDASELYAHNQYHLLELIVRENVITIDWTDEVLAGTCLTHAGKLAHDAPAATPQPAKVA